MAPILTYLFCLHHYGNTELLDIHLSEDCVHIAMGDWGRGQGRTAGKKLAINTIF